MKIFFLCGLLVSPLAAGSLAQTVYTNDFEKAETGKLPDEFMVLGGEFAVKSEGTNRFLELPGAPLEAFGVQFGPVEKENVAVTARIFGTAKGRRAPTFAVGLGGVSGWKLQVSPGKKAIELLKDQEAQTSVPFDWRSGEWMQLRLQLQKTKDAQWKIEGRVWPRGANEPAEWMITATTTEEPLPGKASVLGAPFSTTPIWFDDLAVEKVKE